MRGVQPIRNGPLLQEELGLHYPNCAWANHVRRSASVFATMLGHAGVPQPDHVPWIYPRSPNADWLQCTCLGDPQVVR